MNGEIPVHVPRDRECARPLAWDLNSDKVKATFAFRIQSEQGDVTSITRALVMPLKIHLENGFATWSSHRRLSTDFLQYAHLSVLAERISACVHIDGKG